MTAGRPLTVATVNLQHGLPGEGLADDGTGRVAASHDAGRTTAPGKPRPLSAEALARAFRGVDVDLLALQEVDVGQPRSGGVDQAAIVAGATGMRYARFAAAVGGDVRGARRRPTRTSVPVGYGVALLSRHPVLAWFAQPLPSGALDRARDEPRVALAGIVDTPSGLLCIVATHLSRTSGPRQLADVRRRARDLAARAAAEPGQRLPTLVIGDLNLAPWRMWWAGRLLARAATHPAHAPTYQPDHVVGLGGVAQAGPAVAARLPLSDHRMLTVPVRPV